jgi:hypothetical protein
MYDVLYARAGLTVDINEVSLAVFKEFAAGADFLKADVFHAALSNVQSHYMMTQTDYPILPPCLLDALVNQTITQVKERQLTLNFASWSSALGAQERATLLESNISEGAFLAACNALHQCIAYRVESLITGIGLEPVPKVSFTLSEMVRIFDEIGHVSHEIEVVLSEIVEDQGLQDKEHFSFGEFFTVLLAFVKSAGGYSRVERADIAWVFNEYLSTLQDVERDDSDRVSTSELQRLLRWCCYCPSEHRFCLFMDTYHNASITHLDQTAFFKVLTDYRYDCMLRTRCCFVEVEVMNDRSIRSEWSTLKPNMLEGLLLMAGHNCPEEEADQLRKVHGKDQLSWRDFLELEGLYRKDVTAMHPRSWHPLPTRS